MSDLFKSLPKWVNKSNQCVVGAFQIVRFGSWGSGTCVESKSDTNKLGPVLISPEYINKFQPEIGGYFIAHESGPFSYSPADCFRTNYIPLGAGSAQADEFEINRIKKTIAEIEAKDDFVLVPRGLVGAAVQAIERQTAGTVLELLRHYRFSSGQKVDGESNQVLQRLAAQIAGIKDEVADFMAGRDSALIAGKSVDDLCDELEERIALYDTPEAVDLFMQMVKGRSGVELPRQILEIIEAAEEPEQKLIFTVETSGHKPGCGLSPSVGLALFELNQAQVQSLGMSHRSLASLSDDEKAAERKATELPFVASNGFKVRWYNAAQIAEVMGSAKHSMADRLADVMLKDITRDKELLSAFSQEVVSYNKTNQQGQIELLTAALDAARHELDGKYISANATVIDAYQLTDWQQLDSADFRQWGESVGLTFLRSESRKEIYLGNECKESKESHSVKLGDWIVKYRNVESGRMTFNVFEPEVFATLYTSAAELLK